jgi:hypothetical protein
VARAHDRLRAARVGLRIVERLNSSGVPAVVIDDDADPRLARNVIGWASRTSPAGPARRRPWPRPSWPGRGGDLHPVRAGDRAYLIGPYEELLTVLRRDRPGPGQVQLWQLDNQVISGE